MSLQTRITALAQAIGADVKALLAGLAGKAPAVHTHSATSITNAPAGNIAATNVQDAINELVAEKVAKSGDTMTGPLSQAAGTAALPSYTFSGNTNTGIYSPGENRVGIATAGAQRVEVNASGNVGIGTSSPTAKIDVRAGTIRLSTDDARSAPFGINRSDTGSVNGMASIAMFGSGTNSYLGNITFSTTRVDVFNAAVVEAMRIDGSGNVLVTGSGGLGYGPGSGGSVTQPTSKNTGVTLNKPGGMITTHAESLAAGAATTFALNNSVIASVDVVVATISYHGGAGLNYRVTAHTGLTGQCALTLQNISGTARAEAIEIHFAVIKKVNA